MTTPLEQLFEGAQAFYGPLKGKEWQEEHSNEYFSCHSASNALNKLNLGLQAVHPEAKEPYWRVRAWELSWWQPVSLAMICVYHLKMVPDSLSSIRQYQHHNYIAGYALQDGSWITSTIECRIQSASSQLAHTFDALVAAHINEFKGKIPLYKALLADLVMSYLTQATKNVAGYNVQKIRQDYKMWADFLLLPHDPITKIEQQGNQIVFTRKTCCLAFRCTKSTFCSNCPKHKKLSQKSHV